MNMKNTVIFLHQSMGGGAHKHRPSDDLLNALINFNLDLQQTILMLSSLIKLIIPV